MTKTKSILIAGRLSLTFAMLVVVCARVVPAYSQQDQTALVLQQTPRQGGTITPEPGVHYFAMNTEVTLTAVPKPGYQFVFWLGQVSDPKANSTVVYSDSPKIVIAVFERAKYEFLAEQGVTDWIPGGGLIRRGGDYARAAGPGGGGRRPQKRYLTNGNGQYENGNGNGNGDEDKPDELSVPEVPEPATVVLLGLGGSLIFVGRRRKRKN